MFMIFFSSGNNASSFIYFIFLNLPYLGGTGILRFVQFSLYPNENMDVADLSMFAVWQQIVLKKKP